LNDEVTHLPQSELRRPRRWRRRASGRRSATRRLIRGALLTKAALVTLVLVAGIALYLRIGLAPLRFEGLTEQVTAALAERLGEDWRISLDDSAITLVDGAIGMEVQGLEIRNAEGVLIARAPTALVSVSAWSVVAGDPLPRAIELHDVQLRVQVARDGALSLAPQTATSGIAAGEVPLVAPAPELAAEIDPITIAPPPSLVVALGSFLEMILDPSNPVGAIDYARIVDASLTLVDENGRERVGFSDVDALFATTREGRSFDAEFEGKAGVWRMSGEVARSPDGGRDAAIRIEDIPIDDIVLFAGVPPIIGSDSLRLTGSAEFGIDGDDAVRRFEARLSSSAGRLSIEDPHMSSLRIDDVTAVASWNPESERLMIPTLDYRSGETQISLRGEAVADDAVGGWRLELSGDDVTLGGVSERDRQVAIDRVTLRAHGGPEGVFVEDFTLRGEDVDLALALSFGSANDNGGLRIGLDARDTGVRTALRLWPKFVAPKPREFLVRAAFAGTVENLSLATVITGADLAALARKEGLASEALSIDFRITDGTLLVNDTLPLLEGLMVDGVVDGRSTSISGRAGDVVLADGRSLAFSEGLLRLENFWDKRELAAIDFRLGGPADALASFLGSNGQARSKAVNIDPDEITGAVDLAISAPLLLSDVPAIDDIPIVVTGSLSDLSLGTMLGKETLENGAFTIDYREGDLTLTGAAMISDDQAEITVRQPRDAAGDAVISLVLDDAARARRGLDTNGKVTGPVPIAIHAALGEEREGGTRIEADLSRAAINGLVPGWTKAAGQAGTLSFTLDGAQVIATDAELAGTADIVITDIALDAGSVRARGSVSLSPEGEVREARFDSLRISPGDDANVVVARAGDVWKVTVRGNLIDARPFIDLIAGGGSPVGPGKPISLDLDLRTDILAGHHSEALTNASLALSMRNDQLRQLDLRGRFPGAEISARTGIMPDGAPVILVQSDDAGASLRFADLYTRMVGGEMTFQIGTVGERRSGILLVRDFLLRDEPALRRVVSQNAVGAGRDGQPIDFAAARFTQARVDFIRDAGRIDLEEAVMWGTDVGFKLDGFVDFALDFVDIKGTFVPAYGLNNVFSQIPLFGPILGGGRNEGMFGVNFRVSGPASAPNLTINPLSAIAPGFLRQLFGASGTPYRSPTNAPGSLPQITPSPPLSLAPPGR
jgi:hypothetical protein